MSRRMQYVSTLRIREWGIQLIIVGLLAVSYRGAVAVEGAAYVARVAGMLVCAAFLLAGTYLLNTYCDRDGDRLKPWRSHMPSAMPALVCMAIALGLTAWLGANRMVLLVAVIAAAIGILYSMPPVRLKERGWMGVIAAALFQRIPPFWMIVLSFPIAWAPALAITAWLAVLGFLFILEHQMGDVEFDRAAGVETVVTTRGLARARRTASILYGAFLFVTVAAALAVGSASLLGAGIIVVGSVILVVSARFRYGSARSRSRRDHLPAVEDEDSGVRRHVQQHR